MAKERKLEFIPVGNAEALLISAFTFVRAGNLVCNSRREGDGGLFGPELTLYVFHLELLLKALVALEIGKIPRTHKFSVILAQVSPASREVLHKTYLQLAAESKGIEMARADYNRLPAAHLQKKPFPETLEQLFGYMNESFERIRYHFEDKAFGMIFPYEVSLSIQAAIKALDSEMLARCIDARSSTLPPVKRIY